MSTYSKYIEYAKDAIGELKQLEILKKSVKGAKLAQAIKENFLKMKSLFRLVWTIIHPRKLNL